MSDERLVAYYSRRAAEYEAIYAKPERQVDLAVLRERLLALLAGHRVLELACGTGYWTQFIAADAASVLATDRSPEVLALARRKPLPPGRVEFAEYDAFSLPPLGGRFTAVLAAFWWSHVPRRRLAPFLEQLARALGPGVRAVFADNRFVEGSSTPVARTDEHGDTYQVRRLADGSEHEVLKNFPTRDELLEAAASVGEAIEVTELRYFWLLSFVTRGSTS